MNTSGWIGAGRPGGVKGREGRRLGVQAAELCDDGNGDDDDACQPDCTYSTCGDGHVWAGVEGCDDGNVVDDDGCTNLCTLPSCGDGVVQGGEACDDGNSIADDGCTNACTQGATCGDGVVGGDEGCDDGNSIDDDDCTNLCTLPRCGDGILQMDEACDDANALDDDACRNDCSLPAGASDGCGCVSSEAPAGRRDLVGLLVVGLAGWLRRRRPRAPVPPADRLQSQ